MSHDHDHEHAEHPYMGHHWDTAAQQFSAAKLGMWLFMGQEVLFFAGLFCWYTVLRFNHPEAFVWGSQILDRTWGAINTVVLLVSSLTMALGVRYAQVGNRKMLLTMIGLTFLGGCGFMAIKAHEYSQKFEHGTIWGLRHQAKRSDGTDYTKAGFDYEKVYAAEHAGLTAAQLESGVAAENLANTPATAARTLARDAASSPAGVNRAVLEAEPESTGKHEHHWGEPPPSAHRFFSVYFALTGLHGLHVLIGMGLMIWLFVNAWGGKYTAKYFTQVDIVGLYWHLVDLIWIFLFPLLYLIG